MPLDTNEPQTFEQQWQSRIRRAEEDRDKNGGADWDAWWVEYQQGVDGGTKIKTESGFPAKNLAYPFMASLLANTTYNNPHLLVKPEEVQPLGPELAEQGARMWELLINAVFKLSDVRAQMEQCVKVTSIQGCGVWKLGIGYESGYRFASHIRAKLPWVESSPPETLVVEPGVNELHHARWLAWKHIRHITEIGRTPGWNTDGIVPNADHLGKVYEDFLETERTGSEPSGEPDPALQYLVYYDVWDKENDWNFGVVPGFSQLLYATQGWLQTWGAKFPCEMMHFNRSRFGVWGLSDIGILQGDLSFVQAITDSFRAHAQTSVIKLLAQTDGIEPQDLSSLQDGKLKAIVRCTDDIDKVVKPFSSGIPPELVTALNLGLDSYRETSGQGRNVSGQFETGRRSATEANSVMRFASARFGYRQNIVAQTYKCIGVRMAEIMQQNLTMGDAMDMFGVPGINPIMYQAPLPHFSNFLFDVVPEDLAYTDSNQEEQRALQWLQALAGDPFIDQTKLHQRMAGRVRNTELKDLVTTPQPQQAAAPVEQQEQPQINFNPGASLQ